MARFLTLLYAQIKYRCTKSTHSKSHLYYGKEFLTKEEMLNFINNPIFIKLYNNWIIANKLRKLVPTLDRIDNSKGYNINNIMWRTLGDNSKRANFNYRSKKYLTGTRPYKKSWQSRIKINYEEIILGYFNTEIEAHEVYKKAKENYLK